MWSGLWLHVWQPPTLPATRSVWTALGWEGSPVAEPPGTPQAGATQEEMLGWAAGHTHGLSSSSEPLSVKWKLQVCRKISVQFIFKTFLRKKENAICIKRNRKQFTLFFFLLPWTFGNRTAWKEVVTIAVLVRISVVIRYWTSSKKENP